MSKPTYEDKITTIERYIARPQGMNDIEVLRAIKLDVVKGHSKNVRTAKEEPDNAAYNTCMGVYRDFLKKKGLFLDMKGRKAAFNSAAMKNIINYIREFAKSNGKPHGDDDIVRGVKFMFNHWDRLNDYLRNRVSLPDIYDKIEEILLKIRDGADKKAAAKDELDRFKQSLKD